MVQTNELFRLIGFKQSCSCWLHYFARDYSTFGAIDRAFKMRQVDEEMSEDQVCAVN